jgi:hypothetical protein
LEPVLTSFEQIDKATVLRFPHLASTGPFGASVDVR